jgi:hypothetical protein
MPTTAAATAANAQSGPVPPVTLSPEQIAAYQNEGYLLLPGLLIPSDAEALRAEVLAIMDRIGLGMTKLNSRMSICAAANWMRSSTARTCAPSPRNSWAARPRCTCPSRR